MTYPESLQTIVPPANEAVVPRLQVFLVTLVWTVPLLLLLLNAQFKVVVVEHRTYLSCRAVLILVLLGLGIWGLLRSFDLLKAHAGDPWYTDPLLVGLVLFWGLFPPMWFFVEYLSFDRGSFALPSNLLRELEAATADRGSFALPSNLLRELEAATAEGRAVDASKLRADFLSETKLYADMAAKVWFSVGAALGAVIGLTKR